MTNRPERMQQPTDTKPAKRPSRWHRPLWWLNVAAAIVLAITYLAPHISPLTFWVPALLAMTFTYQLVVHLGFLVWWFLFRRKRMLLSGALLLLGYGHIGDHVQLLGKSAPSEELSGKAFKVMSYNVRLFDLYRDEKIGEGKKSLAYALTYQAEDKTMTDADAAAIRNKIVKRLEKELGAKLRS